MNTLSMECMEFYHKYGGDGRNYTARAVYPCYYDESKPEFVVINYNPEQVKLLFARLWFAALTTPNPFTRLEFCSYSSSPFHPAF